MTPTVQPQSKGGAYVTANATAAILGVHVETVRRWLRAGKLPAVHIGRKWLISQETIDAFRGVPSA